jgi:hypothetical protein
MTAEGRKLTYVLTVIQQPERARACGSGAKCEHHASQSPYEDDSTSHTNIP